MRAFRRGIGISKQKGKALSNAVDANVGCDSKAALPAVEESVAAEGRPGTNVGSFTYPHFEAAEPPELAGDEERSRVQKQVVVVGADPTGLTIALSLARQGIAITLLDARETLASSSRSATWTAHTLELWASCCGAFDLVQAMVSSSVHRCKQQVLVASAGHAPRLAAEMEVDGRLNSSVRPHAIHLQQYVVEQLLYDALLMVPRAEDLVDVRWQTSVDEVVSTHEGVVFQVSVPIQSEGGVRKQTSYELAAVYAVICSANCKKAIQERTATPQPRNPDIVTRTVLTIDVQAPALADDGGEWPDRRLFLSSETGGTPARNGGADADAVWVAVSERRHPDGQLRVDVMLPVGADLPAAAQWACAGAVLESLLGADVRLDVLSCAAQQFRVGPISSASSHGRLFFCGEALAVSSPFGGAGGNLGVQDATNLAWKLALVILQGAPAALLGTYRLERDGAHRIAAERKIRGEQMLAPATGVQHGMQQVALTLLRTGIASGAALLGCVGAPPSPAQLNTSPLVLRDDGGGGGAAFRSGSPGPGDPFRDVAVGDLSLEVDGAKHPVASLLGRDFLLGYMGHFFTLVIFVLSVKDIPWDGLRSIDRSRLQMTLELVRKVVVILDVSGLKRGSDMHVEAMRRAHRVETNLVADVSGGAAAAYDARPGTTLLIRPDLYVAARWRELRPREAHDAFLMSSGHLLHTVPRRPHSPTIDMDAWQLLPQDVAPKVLVLDPRPHLFTGCARDDFLAALSLRLAETPAERQLAVTACAMFLLANHVGNPQVASEALALAATAAGVGHAALGGVDGAGAAKADAPLRLDAPVAQLFEARAPSAIAYADTLGHTFDLKNSRLWSELCLPVAADDMPILVRPDAATETLGAFVNSDDGCDLFAERPPIHGTPKLRERIAMDLSSAEGVEVAEDTVMAMEGPCATLSYLLVALRCRAPGGHREHVAATSSGGDRWPSTSAAAASIGPKTDLGEVLLIGPCRDTWRAALDGLRVRRFDPSCGPKGDFAFCADEVVRHLASETRVVVLPLYSLATGVPPHQDELARLGEFIDYEVARRTSARCAVAREMAGDDRGEVPPLMLLVDVTLRRWQLDSVGEDVAGQMVGAPLQVLSCCRHSLVFGDLFGEYTAAPGIDVQFAACSPVAAASCVLTAAASFASVTHNGGTTILVQELAASLPRETGILESLRRRREVLCEALARAGIAVVGGRPHAGRFLCGRLPDDIDEYAYSKELARRGIVAEAGSILGLPGCIRLSFGLSFNRLEDSVQIFAEALHEIRRIGINTGDGASHEAGATDESDSAWSRPGSVTVTPETKIADNDAGRMCVTSTDLLAAQAHVVGVDNDEASLEASPPQGGPAQCMGCGFEVQDGEDCCLACGQRRDEVSADVYTAVVDPEGQEMSAEEEEDAEDEETDEDTEADRAAVEEAKKAGLVAPLAAQLRCGARGIACVAQLNGSITTELIAQAGFEIIIVDHESGPGDFGHAAELVRSALGAGAHAIFRLPEAEVTQVRRAMEVGAEGVLLPRVASAAEAEEFSCLVREASARVRSDESMEWHGEDVAGAFVVGDGDGFDGPGTPRILVAVEIDPALASSLEVAEAVLNVPGVDLVLLDPEHSIEAIAAEHGFSAGGLPFTVAGGLGVVTQQVAAAEAAAGPGTFEPSFQRASPDGVMDAPPVPLKPSTAQLGGLRARLRSTALRDAPVSPHHGASEAALPPPLKAAGCGARVASPRLPRAASEAQQRYWDRFDRLPSLAAERQRLVGCCAHTRTSAIDLLVAGHSVVVLAADVVLLREGAKRHVCEQKGEWSLAQVQQLGAGRLQYVTPFENARARLATASLVSQLRRERRALGAFVHLGDALAAEFVALGGFEVLVLDHEKGPGDLLNAVSLIHAASSAGAHSLLRVPGQDATYLRRALQLGVEGVILPRVESAEQAKNFVALARRSWPASSLRGGAGPSAATLRPCIAGTAAQHLRHRGEEFLMKVCQVETPAGLAAVQDIAAVDGIDMVFFAPVELAASAARGQEAGLFMALATAEAAVKQAGKLLGGMSVPGRSVEQMFQMGYDFVCSTSDVILIRSAAENIVHEAKLSTNRMLAAGITWEWVTSGRKGRVAQDSETLVARLKKSRKARVLGVLSRIGSSVAADIMMCEGFDVIVLDHARGPGDLLGAVGLVHAAARAGAHAIIRVPALNHAHVFRALQIGVEGVILPHVENAQEAHELVELCLSPMGKGDREDTHASQSRLKNQPFRRMDFSFAPPLVEFYGQRVAEFARRQGEAVLIAAQIDTVAGAQAVRDIAKVPGIDMIFVDPTRLSGTDVERVETAAKDEGRLLGGLLVPGCTAEQMYRSGYKLVCAVSDCGLLATGVRMCLQAMRGPATDSKFPRSRV